VNLRKITLLLLPCLLAVQPLYACSSAIPIRRLGPETGSYTLNSGIDSPQQLLINDAETFAVTWRKIHAKRRPQPDLPDIDFEQSTVIVVAAGQQSSGGVEIRIDRVYDEDGLVIIDVTVSRSASDCIVSTGLTQPIDIAIVPKIDRPHEFRLLEVVRTCKAMFQGNGQ
jgi:hypothetical protein